MDRRGFLFASLAALAAQLAVEARAYLAKAQEVCDRAGFEPDVLMVLRFLC